MYSTSFCTWPNKKDPPPQRFLRKLWVPILLSFVGQWLVYAIKDLFGPRKGMAAGGRLLAIFRR